MKTGLGLIAGAVALIGLASPAAAADAWLTGRSDGNVLLMYGARPPAGERPNPETIQISLACRTGSGVVRLFIGESSAKLKPSGTAQLTLATARVATTVRAKILPNELAGVPSLQATAPVGSAVFNALARLGRAGRGTLRISVGTVWSANFPLRTMGLQAQQFARACGPKTR